MTPTNPKEQKMSKITDRDLREYLLENPAHLRIKIRRDGGVEIQTTESRGDGGPTPWWKFAGWKDELKQQIEIELE